VQCFTVSIDGEIGWFFPKVMTVGRGDATGVPWPLSDIGVLRSAPLCCSVHQVGENDINTCGS
jgi:hypothetical protein